MNIIPVQIYVYVLTKMNFFQPLLKNIPFYSNHFYKEQTGGV